MTVTVRSVPVGEVRRFGDRAFLIGVEDASAGRALASALHGALAAHAGGTGPDQAEVVGGQATVLVALGDDDAEPEAVRQVVAEVLAEGRGTAGADGGAARRSTPPGAGRLVTVACAFDGPDLEEVARRARCTPEEVVRLLTAHALTVGVVGFSPGFAYLEGLPGPLAGVARRAEPRPIVPAGSVAVANGHAAVYPTASPGGWHLVGRTGASLFSAEHPPYAVLAPGDRVRFTPAGPGDPLEPAPAPASRASWRPPSGARPVLEVLAPGLRAVLQDAGRRGVAAAGVPGAGPADPVSFTLANRLVNNATQAATLELTGGGARLRALAACHVAVVGAAPELSVDGAAVPPGRVLPLAEGQVLAVRGLRQGCRTYVAVAGGIEGPTLFGSRASDELTGLGPGALGPGHRLVAGPWTAPLGDHVVPGAASEVTEGGPVLLRVVPGPHVEHFAPDALAHLARTVFRVQRDSNRVGLRLRAEDAGGLAHLAAGGAAGSLDSHGVVTGAVQLPPGGEPVVLLPDHATLGGYPVVAVVVRADHGRLGQCAPGTAVRLVPVSADEADEAARAARRAQRAAVRGRYPLAAG